MVADRGKFLSDLNAHGKQALDEFWGILKHCTGSADGLSELMHEHNWRRVEFS
jgi:hypothetical protein